MHLRLSAFRDNVHFNTFRPSSLRLSDRPVWHIFTSIYPKKLRITVYFDPWPSTIVLDRPIWLEWLSGLTQDFPLLDGPSAVTRPSTLIQFIVLNKDRSLSLLWAVHFGPDSNIMYKLTMYYRPYIFDRGENKFEKYFFLRKEQCSWLRCFLFSFCSCSQSQKFFMFLFCSCSRTRTSSRTCSRTTCVFFHPCHRV